MPRLRVDDIALCYKPRVPTKLIEPVNRAASIAKKIHQTFPHKDLPPEIQNNVDRLKELNPGWEYHFYDDSDIEAFIVREYGDAVFQFYKRINSSYGASRADFFRYLLLYKLGGVYLDIKSSATKSFDEVLKNDDQYLLSHWDNGPGGEFEGAGIHHDMPGQGEYQQWFIIAAAGHPYLLAVIQSVLININKYNPVLHGVGQYGVLRLSGPVIYTKTINRIRSSNEHRIVNSASELGLRYSIYKAKRNDNMHQKIFKMHYSQNTSPIVSLTVADKLLTGVLSLVERLKNALAPKF